jgi:hypothetical protein
MNAPDREDVVPLPLPAPALGVNGKNSYQRAVKKAALDAKPANENGAPPDALTKAEISNLLDLSGPHTDRLIGKRGAKLEPVRGPSGGLGRTRRYSRAHVERLIADRAAKAAERSSRAVVRPDRPFKGEPVVAPRRPPAPAPQPVLDGPTLSPHASTDEGFDPVALGVSLPRDLSGEASVEIAEPIVDRLPDERSAKRRSFRGMLKIPVGPTPEEQERSRARDRARAAALGQLDPSKIKRLPSAYSIHQNLVSENARFAAETERLKASTEKPFKSGMTAAGRQELDRDERIMLQRASWVARGVIPPK